MKRLLLAMVLVVAFSTCHAQARGGISVVDGDTLRIGGESIRIMGLDTPEKGRLAQCPREAAMARAASRRMEQLVANGITWQAYGRDRYRRTLARVYDRQGRDVAHVMIREGYAVAYHGRGRRGGWCNG